MKANRSGGQVATGFKKGKFFEAFAGETRALISWAAVLYGLGIGLYFLMPTEPPLWPPLVAAGLLGLFLGSVRTRPGLTVLLRALLLVAAGFSIAILRTHLVDTKTLGRETGPIALEATVERAEDRLEDGLRVTLKDIRYETGGQELPDRIRLVVRTQHPDLRPGMVVKTRGVLLPLPEPVIPGGYDFARQLWFEGLGAVGFAVAPVEILGQPEITWGQKIERLRQTLYKRITKAAPGPGGAVAAALVTGIRDGIPEKTSEDMRIAGLAHLLAISGLHMALVTGVLFLVLKGLLALIPGIALRFPVKKIAAVGAFLGAVGYLLLSGASLSTERAFIMVAIVLLAVLVDRRAISMRLVSIAAIVVLTLNPEALLHPSFQMSFAAVTGLVAGYAWLKPRFAVIRETHPGPLGRFRLYVLGVIASTLIAEVTIGPIALYHFGRFAVYGLPANLLAMPILGFLVMPLGLLGLALTPFGLDAYAWQAMAFFMGVILDIAHFFAGLPGADYMFPKIPHGALVLLVLGGLWLTLWQSPAIRRWFAVPVLAGILVYAVFDLPDAIIERDGRLVAFKGGGGEYYFNSLRTASFSRENWQRTLGQARLADFGNFPDLPGVSLSCDPLGCLYRKDNIDLALIGDPAGFFEDCRRADIILTSQYAPFSCKDRKIVIDRAALRKAGAHAVYLNGTIKVVSAGEVRGVRPWTNSPQ